MAALPRVWLAAYLKDWSYDFAAQAMVRHLSHRFEFRVAYQQQVTDGILETWPADLIVDFWWHGILHHHYGRRVMKQISSHRWQMEKWGRLKPTSVLQRFATDVSAIIVPSVRLRELMREVDVDDEHAIMLAPKGYEPSLLEDYGMRRGELAIGWAGVADGKDKHVSTLTAADPTIRLADHCLTQQEMGDFYNAIDVIAIASEAEGDPRPLIEGMACGCFPVTTDVGIVPELVVDGVNGLIVERTPLAFVDAFNWCRANIEFVRETGRKNAAAMCSSRTWAHVMPAWGDAIDVALSRQ